MKISTIFVCLCYVILVSGLPIYSSVERTSEVVFTPPTIKMGVHPMLLKILAIPSDTDDPYYNEPHPADAAYQVLEARGGGNIIGTIVKGVFKGVKAIVNAIKAKNEARKDKRNHFVDDTLTALRNNDSTWNYLIIKDHHPKEVKWEGVENIDWGVDHESCEGTAYLIYHAQAGDVYNKGDGGFLNWGYNGFYEKDSKDARHVHFSQNPNWHRPDNSTSGS